MAGETKARTSEEIRAAVHAEVGGLRAMAKRLAALHEELRATTEWKRHQTLWGGKGAAGDDNPELFALEVMGGMEYSLGEAVGGLKEAVACLGEDSSPKHWAEAPERARASAEETRRMNAKRAKAKPKPEALLPSGTPWFSAPSVRVPTEALALVGLGVSLYSKPRFLSDRKVGVSLRSFGRLLCDLAGKDAVAAERKRHAQVVAERQRCSSQQQGRTKAKSAA